MENEAMTIPFDGGKMQKIDQMPDKCPLQQMDLAINRRLLWRLNHPKQPFMQAGEQALKHPLALPYVMQPTSTF